MNEFIEQFLLESRELVEQATADLLALEKEPANAARLDSAFRAFHTLKGGAGIVEFTVMERAVHRAEDVLQAVRSGERRVSPTLIGDCLACLDHVTRWLDLMQETGEIPVGAAPDAEQIIARFAKSSDGDGGSGPVSSAAQPETWVSALLDAHSSVRARATTAVRYTPDADCFFRGEDPLARVSGLAGLLSLDISPAAPWPRLDEFDPYTCNLVLTLLTDTAVSEVAGALGDAAGQCEILSLALEQATYGANPLPQHVREVLEAQLSLLAENEPAGLRGRMASAGIVAARVLRHLGRAPEAVLVSGVADQGVNENSPEVLRRAIESVLNGMSPPPAAVASSHTAVEGTRTLRVDAGRIDALVNLTGELMVAKNAIGHAAKLLQGEDNAFAPILKERYLVLDRLLGELQRSVIGLRVLPLRLVFQRFPRLMREMAEKLGKPVNLIIEGDATEADKVIVEMLFDPLLHVLRNAMDHGIEAPPLRASAGKPAVASIRLGAFRQGEHVVIEISDDGAGIDVNKVREVARKRKTVADDILDELGEDELIRLIFAPGFSTAADVTAFSGRGVGMDAVQTSVERFGGEVAIASKPGHGTTLRFTLPFSIVMMRVMTVEAGGQMFGIPLDALVETARVGSDAIFPVGTAKAIVLRDRTVPLVELDALLGVERRVRADSDATIVVASVEGQLGALRVDRLGERMEIMLKPLEGLLSGTPGIAGSSILGDGSVLLVLDLGEILV